MSFLNPRLRAAVRQNQSRQNRLAKSRTRKLFLEALEDRSLMATMTGDPVLGSDWEASVDTYYPPSTYQASTGNYLSGPATGDKLTIALNYLRSNAAQFGLTKADLNNLQVTDNYVSSKTGMTQIYLQQTFNGLPIEGALININIASDGRVLTAGSSFLPGLPPPPPVVLTPAFSVQDALGDFSSQSSYFADSRILSTYTDGVRRDQASRINIASGDRTAVVHGDLHYVPTAAGGVELAWHLSRLYTFDGQHAYDVSISLDPSSERYGQVIRIADWVENASYNVFAMPGESPLDSVRTIVVDPQDPVASPNGWHDYDGFPGPDFYDTRGNNVFAQEDSNANDAGGIRPQGGPTLDFNPPLDLTLQPPAYNQAATLNLFYWNNIMHDVSYHYGFDEVSGNFQRVNYTGLGKGKDQVFADSQDGSGVNNANFLTPPDGESPRMQQFIFPAAPPLLNRDSDLEAPIIIHEYTHGISNRLTGGPANANALQAIQSGGMGEGWGDFMGLMLTQRATDLPGDAYPVGNYVLQLPATGPGIRRFPYSYDMSIDPLVLGDFNGGFPANEVHNAGEIWASVLWDLNWVMIEKYGFDEDIYNGTGGNNMTIQLVLDGMKLQPANPTFTQARDAILAADLALNGGADLVELWTAFARRGFGINARSGGHADSQVVIESYEVPPPTQVKGVVFNDANNSASRQAGEPGLANYIVYVDSNNNGVKEATEQGVTSAADGSYTLSIYKTGDTVIRQVAQPEYTQTMPANNGGYSVTIAGSGGLITGKDFGNYERPGEIHGFKWNDLNNDGVHDENEPGLAGIMFYVDLNNNNKVGVGEPAAYSDANGNFTIKNVRPGTYTVREVLTPGQTQTFPANLGVYSGVVVLRNQITTIGEFGNHEERDWGDAPILLNGVPTNYPVLAPGGASHAVLAGFGLGALTDAEPNGQPSVGADGDDLFPVPPVVVPPATPIVTDDEDGVIITGITPGKTGLATVTVRTGGYSSGRLQGWVDFNQDGDWDDAGEQIFKDVALGAGTFNLSFPVPAAAKLGATYARFRYGYENGIGPGGSGGAGEVEDYLVNVLGDATTGPVAQNDAFPKPGAPLIKANTVDNPLPGVLNNDVGIVVGGVIVPPTIVAGDFPKTTSQGGTVRIDPTDPTLFLYTSPPAPTGLPDTFTYRVQANGQFSQPATVSVSVTTSDPIAVDDAYTFNEGNTLRTLTVLSNDIIVNPATTSLTLDPFTPVLPTVGTVSVDSANKTVLFTPAVGFRGTAIFNYIIQDSTPGTNPSTGVITVQVSNTVPGQGDPDYPAMIALTATDINGNPITSVNEGDDFYVQAVATDLRTTTLRGVAAAFVDIIPRLSFTAPDGVVYFSTIPTTPPPTPIPPRTQPFDWQLFNIEYGAQFNTPELRSGSANRPVPGVIDEAGAADQSNSPLIQTLPYLFRVKMHALQALPAGQTVQFIADPADGKPGEDTTKVILTNGEFPQILTDEEVFLVSTGTLQILGSGEGEFTNTTDPLDVDQDSHVTPLDALIVVNELNAHGSRPLTQASFAQSGILPPQFFLDVNGDQFISPLDALFVINHLNVGLPIGSGEAEGEAAAPLAAPLAATVSSDIAPAASPAIQGFIPPQQVNSHAAASASDSPAIVASNASAASLNDQVYARSLDSLLGGTNDLPASSGSDTAADEGLTSYLESDDFLAPLYGPKNR